METSTEKANRMAQEMLEELELVMAEEEGSQANEEKEASPSPAVQVKKA